MISEHVRVCYLLTDPSKLANKVYNAHNALMEEIS